MLLPFRNPQSSFVQKILCVCVTNLGITFSLNSRIFLSTIHSGHDYGLEGQVWGCSVDNPNLSVVMV